MTTPLRRSLAAALAAAVLLPAAATAAPDRQGAIDETTPELTWDTKLGTGFTTIANLHDKIPCGTPVLHDCDFTLIRVTGPGTVAVSNESSDPNAADTDLYVYESDESGARGSELSHSSASTPTPNEATAVDVTDEVTWLLVETDYAINVAGTVHGKAVFTPAPPEETP